MRAMKSQGVDPSQECDPFYLHTLAARRKFPLKRTYRSFFGVATRVPVPGRKIIDALLHTGEQILLGPGASTRILPRPSAQIIEANNGRKC